MSRVTVPKVGQLKCTPALNNVETLVMQMLERHPIAVVNNYKHSNPSDLLPNISFQVLCDLGNIPNMVC